MNRKWLLAGVCFTVAGVSLAGLAYIAHVYLTPSKAFGDAAPPVTSAGFLQMAVLALTTLMGSGGGVLVTILNLWSKLHGATPVIPLPSPSPDPINPPSPNQPQVLSDLLEAFPAWMGDRTNVAKARRFWFDLLEMGIAMDPDVETQKWLMDGTEIMRKKFFQVPATGKAA